MREKILKILKSSSGYISGETISSQLGVSRAAIWKHIKALREDGYEIESVTNKGYRLTKSPDRLTAAELSDGLSTSLIGQHAVFFEETDSTNIQAKRFSEQPDGTVFVTECQTGGKGRLGRSWFGPPGVGVWMSLLLKPSLAPEDVPQLTLIAGLAVCRAVRTVSHLPAMIKWPNDVILNGKKICGILTELSAEMEQVNFVVCGIGVNVNTEGFGGELSKKATSLLIESGTPQDRKAIAQSVLTEFEALYRLFLKEGFSPLLPEYKSFCATLGKDVTISRAGKEESARAVDIDSSGCLVIDQSGTRTSIQSGEVSVRGIYGYA